MYKVFFDQKQIIIAGEEDIPNGRNLAMHIFQTPKKLQCAIESFIGSVQEDLLILTGLPAPILFQQLCVLYPVREAAGGIVENEKKEILMIFRNGKWDLPKGHSEAGEMPLETALRETWEETGVTGLVPGPYFADTWHLYRLKGQWVLKHSQWFCMRAFRTSALIPQLEEGITETKWADPRDLPHLFKNTYLSIAELLTSFLNKTKK
ncbi:MAG: NUDIX domain-containing protein [Bacteroidales bacterium]|nr:NUDIX domain-containing protein [Bacteroidales bacterium]MDD3960299.1 NUDIX domain-containing protein [Bacteroidales bacterium]MDY0284752.1 NUDIX domain-containing protein [Bacteroidales bacterium]HPE86362.1 NUDIX domain-containing protein [Bacteroidales bacterium]